MAGNSRTTFTKRSKERARQEKRADKSQKMEQRKLQKQADEPAKRDGEPVIQYDEDGQPIALGFHDFYPFPGRAAFVLRAINNRISPYATAKSGMSAAVRQAPSWFSSPWERLLCPCQKTEQSAFG